MAGEWLELATFIKLPISLETVFNGRSDLVYKGKPDHSPPEWGDHTVEGGRGGGHIFAISNRQSFKIICPTLTSIKNIHFFERKTNYFWKPSPLFIACVLHAIQNSNSYKCFFVIFCQKKHWVSLQMSRDWCIIAYM